MNKRQVKSNLNLINETRRVLDQYGWRREDYGTVWGGSYEDGFTLEGAVEAAARIRNTNPSFLHELLDVEVWNRTCGKYSYAFEYNSAPSRRKRDVFKLLDTVETVLQKSLS